MESLPNDCFCMKKHALIPLPHSPLLPLMPIHPFSPSPSCHCIPFETLMPSASIKKRTPDQSCHSPPDLLQGAWPSPLAEGIARIATRIDDARLAVFRAKPRQARNAAQRAGLKRRNEPGLEHGPSAMPEKIRWVVRKASSMTHIIS